jgi:hypothetical protein
MIRFSSEVVCLKRRRLLIISFSPRNAQGVERMGKEQGRATADHDAYDKCHQIFFSVVVGLKPRSTRCVPGLAPFTSLSIVR